MVAISEDQFTPVFSQPVDNYLKKSSLIFLDTNNKHIFAQEIQLTSINLRSDFFLSIFFLNLEIFCKIEHQKFVY